MEFEVANHLNPGIDFLNEFRKSPDSKRILKLILKLLLFFQSKLQQQVTTTIYSNKLQQEVTTSSYDNKLRQQVTATSYNNKLQ